MKLTFIIIINYDVYEIVMFLCLTKVVRVYIVLAMNSRCKCAFVLREEKDVEIASNVICLCLHRFSAQNNRQTWWFELFFIRFIISFFFLCASDNKIEVHWWRRGDRNEQMYVCVCDCAYSHEKHHAS